MQKRIPSLRLSLLARVYLSLTCASTKSRLHCPFKLEIMITGFNHSLENVGMPRSQGTLIAKNMIALTASKVEVPTASRRFQETPLDFLPSRQEKRRKCFSLESTTRCLRTHQPRYDSLTRLLEFFFWI